MLYTKQTVAYLLFVWLLATASAASAYKDDRVVLGYFPVQRTVDDIPWGSLTHANVAFAFASKNGNLSFEGKVVNSTTTSEENARSLIAEGQKNGVKMMVAVGGQGNFSGYLASALSTPSGRSSFVSNAMGFVKDYNLDGIDIDWEYPKSKAEAENLLSTLQSTRKALDQNFSQDTRKLLTMTLYNHPYLGPDVPRLDYKPYSDAVDFGMVMAYDYFGSWTDYTAPDAPFLDVPFYAGSFRNTTDSWLQAGWPANKLVAGLAFYGHSSVVTVDMSKNMTNQFVPIDDHTTVDGPVSVISGTWTWRDLRDPNTGALSSQRTARDGWKRAWGKYTMTPWVFRESDKLYIGYDDQDSLGIKMDYSLRNGLRGVMIWEIGYDYKNELISYVHDFITNTDKGKTAKNCAPSNSDLDSMYSASRNPNFFNQQWLRKRDSHHDQEFCKFTGDGGSSFRSPRQSSLVMVGAATAIATAIILLV